MRTNKLAVKMIGNAARDLGHNVRNFQNQTEVTVKNKTGLVSTFVIRLIDSTKVRINKIELNINTLNDLESSIKLALQEFKKLV